MRIEDEEDERLLLCERDERVIVVMIDWWS